MRKDSGEQKFLFICETPLQVLNACRFVLSNMEKSAGRSDICLFHLFRGATETAERLRHVKLFGCVTEIAAFPEYRGICGKMSTLCRMLMPKHTLKKYAVNMDDRFFEGSYSHVILCHTTPTARAVRQCFPKARFLLLEDGTGSYVGNILEDQKSGVLRMVERILPHMKRMFLPAAQYLSNKDLYIGEMKVPVYQLPQLSEEDAERIAQVFSYQTNSFYEEADAVFLSQPLEHLGSDAEKIDGEVQRLLQSVFHENAVVRVHPRHVGFQTMLKRDAWGNLWELECIRQIESRHILVGYCSTAQFMPKILRNEEPVLVFLYKLYGGEEDSFSARFEKLIDEFRKSYANPQRIAVPENLQELSDILLKWKDKRKD